MIVLGIYVLVFWELRIKRNRELKIFSLFQLYKVVYEIFKLKYFYYFCNSGIW